MEKYKVFVYGSLMRGEFNHYILERSIYLGRSTTLKKYTLYDLGAFPAVVEGGNTSIVGEVFEVSGLTLMNLDALESHPQFYRRRLIELSGGQVVFMYILDPGFLRNELTIGSGNWKKR